MPKTAVKNNASLFSARSEKLAPHINLTERDSERVLDLLRNPPGPIAKLMSAARLLLTRRYSSSGH